MKKTICFAILAALLFNSPPAFSDSDDITLTPIADTYICQSDKGIHPSSEPYLYVSATGGNVKKSFILFYTDKTRLASHRVYFKIKTNKIETEKTPGTVSLYGLKEQSFKQGTVDYVSAPATGSKICDLSLAEGKYCSADVTDYFDKNISSRGYIGFALVEAANTKSTYSFISSDNREGGPRLFIDNNYIEPEKPPVAETKQTSTAADATILEKEADLESVPAPTVPEFPDYVNIEDYTTTRYSPWLVNYHLTLPEQVAADRKGGEAGQMMWALTLAPSDPDKMLLGSDTELIYRSEDGGSTWRSSAAGLKTFGTVDISFHPDDENTAFVCASLTSASNTKAVNSNVGIYKSSDGGRTWVMKQRTDFYRDHSLKLICFSEPDEDGKRKIFIGAHAGGLWCSEDNGESWSNCGLTDKRIFQVEYKAGILIATTTNDGIWVSTDYGAEWKRSADGLGEDIGVYGVAIDPLNIRHWVCTTDSNVYESNDSGGSWSKINDKKTIRSNGLRGLMYGPINKNGSVRLYLSSAQSQHSMRYSDDGGKTFKTPTVNHDTAFMKFNWGYWPEPFVIDPNDADSMYVSLDGELYRSWDGGETLQSLAGGYSGVRGTTFLFNKNDPDDIMLTSVDRGVMRSIYTEKDEMYPLMYYAPMESKSIVGGKTGYGLDRDSSFNPNHIMATMGGWGGIYTLYQSFDNGINWSHIPELYAKASSVIRFHKSKEGFIYGGTRISRDGGKTWEMLETTIPIISSTNSDVVYNKTGGTLYVSQDAGATWRQFTTTNISVVSNFIVDVANPFKLYGGSPQNGMFIIDDGEVRKIDENNGLQRSYGNNLCITVVAQNPRNHLHLVCGGVDNIALAPSKGIFESLDGGETWRLIEMPPPADVWRVEFHPTRPQVFIGTSAGTYVYEYENYYDRSEKYFKDIDGAECEEAVNSLLSRGCLSDYGYAEVFPDKTVRRGEFLAFLDKILDLKRINKQDLFTDVPKESRYYSSVQAAADCGIVLIGDAKSGKLGIQDELTMQEAAIYLYRVLSANGMRINVGMRDIRSYTDNTVTANAKFPVTALCKAGIAKESFNYKWAEKATRGKLAILLASTLDMIE